MSGRVPLKARLADWAYERLHDLLEWVTPHAVPAWDIGLEEEDGDARYIDEDPGYDAGYQDGYEKGARAATDDGPHWPDGW